jgi:hypothetical protein
MATFTAAQLYAKDGETVTVPAKLFLDLVEACGWVPGMAASIDLDETEDPDAVTYLSGESVVIRKQAVDWIAQNWREIPEDTLEF